MAISYDLELSPEQVARQLLDVARREKLLDAPVTPEQILRDGAVTPLHTWIRVYERKPAAWAPVITDLGITPTVAAGFSLHKHDKIAEQQDDMIRLSAGLLEHVPGDALLSGMDTIWLLRRNGALTVNEQDDIWPPRRLAVLRQPYRRATQTFAED
ncbi:SitI3 family protein [Amycolatopsis sp. NBC_01286]|uniref:SitI3 family protein n=1 Tax=Amycolatopsis sp. NBC_01286 TaxID=2903560 RepID=UPI002E1659AE|nr:SitI3 family protein [Amycolatopsis sp. NBC_01286]